MLLFLGKVQKLSDMFGEWVIGGCTQRTLVPKVIFFKLDF